MAEYKQWRNTERTYLKDVVPLDTPYSLMVETSSLCNARCVYCAHSSSKSMYKGNMSIELFERIIRDVKEFPSKLKLIDMYGLGEPLCNPNLSKMIKAIKRENVADSVSITTNGLLFNKENIVEIIESGVDIIRISIQGLSEGKYAEVCGVKMNYDKFLENLRYLFENKKQCSIRIKIADISIKDVKNGDNLFKEMFGGIADSIFVEKIIPVYSDVDYSMIDSSIIGNSMNGREDIKQEKINTVCSRPFYRLRVSAQGIVSASCCDTPHDFIFGDINEDSLIDLWNGEKRKSLLKMQLRGDRFKHPVCKKCIIPNDITSEADVLDTFADELLSKFN